MRIKKFRDCMDNLSRTLTALFLIGLIITVALQVAMRQVLLLATPWSEELSKHFLIWATFVGSISLYIRGDHLLVDILSHTYSPLLKQIYRIAVNLIAIGVCGSLTKFGYQLCTHRMVLDSITNGMEISRVWMYIFLPGSMAIVTLLAALDIYQTVCGIYNGDYKKVVGDEIEEHTGGAF